MNDLYKSYLEAFKTSVIINPIGINQFSSPSRSIENWFYQIHYDGTGLPLCTCDAGKFKQPCCHAAATIAMIHPEIQRLWDHRRIFESNRRALLIRQGKVNPKRYPRIRREMEKITERHPVTISPALCTRCGLVLADDMCAECWSQLRAIWPDDPAFARQLEVIDADERWRLKLGVGE